MIEHQMKVTVDDKCIGNTEVYIWDESKFKDIDERVIIGHSWMQKVGINIQEKDKKVEITYNPKKVVIRHMR